MIRKPRIKNRVRRELSDSFIRTCRHYGIRKCVFDSATHPVDRSRYIFYGNYDGRMIISNERLLRDYLDPIMEETMIEFRKVLKDLQDPAFEVDRIEKISISFERILEVDMDQPMNLDIEVHYHSFVVKKIRTTRGLKELVGRMEFFAGYRAKGTFFDIFRLSFKLKEDCIISDELEEEIRGIEYHLNDLISVFEFNNGDDRTILRTIDYFKRGWSEDISGSGRPDDVRMNTSNDIGFHVGINLGYENKYQRRIV